MFGFLKKKAAPAASSHPELHSYKDSFAAFDAHCRNLDCSIRPGRPLSAIVLDAKDFLQKDSVSILDNGIQRAILKVASRDGGFIVVADSYGAKGPKLQPGLLVEWIPSHHSDERLKYLSVLGPAARDRRCGWFGCILGTLRPIYDMSRADWLPESVFEKSSSVPASGEPTLLTYKNATSAFQSQCTTMDCTVSIGKALPALVVDAQKELGAEDNGVATDDRGHQMAFLKVASSDGGFVVAATANAPGGPTLYPGQLVLWCPVTFDARVGQPFGDVRFAWLGKIIGTLTPTYDRERSMWVPEAVF